MESGGAIRLEQSGQAGLVYDSVVGDAEGGEFEKI